MKLFILIVIIVGFLALTGCVEPTPESIRVTGQVSSVARIGGGFWGRTKYTRVIVEGIAVKIPGHDVRINLRDLVTIEVYRKSSGGGWALREFKKH